MSVVHDIHVPLPLTEAGLDGLHSHTMYTDSREADRLRAVRLYLYGLLITRYSIHTYFGDIPVFNVSF